MGPHLQRAFLLLEQSRHEMAEEEVRKELGVDPDSAVAHSLLAICLVNRKQFRDATAAAERGVHLDPEIPFGHYALACVLSERNRLPEAEAAIEQAIRIEPGDPDFLALLASIKYQQRDWTGALEATERGLATDPEHIQCTNLRAICLVNLGRRDEAGATIEAAMAKDPENATTHANQGWALLDRGQPAEALKHFRESLRLDPTLDWARLGIVEALKARHFIYRMMLRYFLWMGKLSQRAQWMLIIGAFIGFRILRSIAANVPELRPFILPLLGVYLGFVFLSWTADSLFNLLLRINRDGRLALTPDKIVASNWIGGCILLAAVFLAVALVTGWTIFLLAALVSGVLIIPLSGTFHCSKGWPRRAMACYTAALAVIGFTWFGLVLVPVESGIVDSIRNLFAVLFPIGTLLSSWVANGLMMTRPRH